MPEETVFFRGDETSLVKAINKAVAAWNRLKKSEEELLGVTVKLGKDISKARAIVESTDATNRKIARSFKVIDGQVRLVTTAVQDNTVAWKLQQDVINKQLRVQEAARISARRLAEAQEAAARAAEESAKRQARAQALGAVRGTRPAISQLGLAAASQSELEAIRRQEAALAELVQKHNLSAAEVLRLWRGVIRGRLSLEQGGTRRIQEQLLRLRKAHEGLGRAALVAAQKQNTALRAAARRAGEAGRATDRAKQSVDRFAITWSSLVRLLTSQIIYRAIFGLSAQLREAFETAVELQVAIAEIQTIAPPTESFREWNSVLRELSDSFGIDIIDQAEAAYQTLSNQILDTTADFTVFGDTVNRFALATKSTSEDSVNLLTGALNAFRLEATDAEEVAAQLFKTIEQGRVRASEMANSLGNVAILANQLGVEMSELLGLIATLTVQGVKFNEAATQIRGIFIKLLKPTKETKRFFKELGVESGESAVKMLGFTKFMELLIKRAKGSSTEIAKFINRIRGLSGVLAITGEGFTKLEDNIKLITESTGSFDRAVNLVLQNTGKNLQISLNAIKNFLIQDVAGVFLKDLAALTGGFENLTKAAKAFVSVLSSLLIPTIATFGAVIISNLGKNLTKTLGFGAFFAATLILSKALQKILTEQARIADALEDIIAKAAQSAAKAAAELRQNVDDVLDDIENFLERRGSALERAATQFVATFIAETDRATQALDDLQDKSKDINREFVRGLNKGLRALEKELANLEKRISGIFEFLIERTREFENLQFQISIDDKSIEQQIQAITQRIVDLQNEASTAATAGADDRVKELIALIQELFLRRRDLEREIITDAAEEAREIQDDIKNAQEDVNEGLKDEEVIQQRINALLRDRFAAQTSTRGTRESRTERVRRIDERIRTQVEKLETLRVKTAEFRIELSRLIVALTQLDIAGAFVTPTSDVDLTELKALDAQRLATQQGLIELKNQEQIIAGELLTVLRLDAEAEEKLVTAREELIKKADILKTKQEEFSAEQVVQASNLDVIHEKFERQRESINELIKKQKAAGKTTIDIQPLIDQLKVLSETETEEVLQAIRDTFDAQREVITELISLQTKLGSTKLDIAPLVAELRQLADLETAIISETRVDIAIEQIAEARRKLTITTDALREKSDVAVDRVQEITDLLLVIEGLFQDPRTREALENLNRASGESFPLRSGFDVTGTADFVEILNQLQISIERLKDVGDVKTAKDVLKQLETFFGSVTFLNTELTSDLVFIEELTRKFIGTATQSEAEFKNLTGFLESFKALNRLLKETVGPGVPLDRQEFLADFKAVVADNRAQTEDIAQELARIFLKEEELIGRQGDSVEQFNFGIKTFISGLDAALNKLEGILLEVSAGTFRRTQDILEKQHGGIIPGIGNTDSIPALLTPGEFVVNKDSTRKFFSQLLSINSGITPQGFNEGGLVEVGGITVNVAEAGNPQSTAKEVVTEINRGLRQGSFRLSPNRRRF